MKKLALATSILLSLSANAALYDRGNGMIYDSEQDITWLQDANYVYTSGYGPQHADSSAYGVNVIHYDGTMGWGAAKTWSENLVYSGYDDWRLPSARLIGDSNFSNDGSSDYGWNITRSELGHLYFELGNVSRCDSQGSCRIAGYGFTKTSFIDPNSNLAVSFKNVSSGFFYWDLESSNSTTAWIFSSWSGEQEYLEKHYAGLVWVVRDGDVAAVPVPAAAWLFGSGLIGLAAARKRKTH